MFKKIIFIFPLLLSLLGCGQKLYKIEKDKHGEPLLNNKAQYSLTEKPSNEDLKKIDTSAYYVQIFEGRYYNDDEKRNPEILIFHNDGYFRKTSFLAFGRFDEHRRKNSTAYGGKYKINGSEILTERFLPASQGKTNWYIRNMTIGKIEGDKIIFKDKNSVTVFEKRKELHNRDN